MRCCWVGWLVGPTGLINSSRGGETGRGRALFSPWRYRHSGRKRNILFFLFFPLSKYPSGRSDKKGAEMYCNQEGKKESPPTFSDLKGGKAFSFPLCRRGNCRVQRTISIYPRFSTLSKRDPGTISVFDKFTTFNLFIECMCGDFHPPVNKSPLV